MNRVAKLSAVTVMSSILLASAAALACGGHDGEPGKGPLTRMDANADGKVTQAEMIAGFTARFDAADTNKDGTVTPAERAAAHTAHMEERITALDTNKNGSIERSEAQGPLAHFFDAVDTDKSGALSNAELESHRAAFEKDHPRKDRTGDEEPATKAAVVTKATEHFKRLDNNGDGVLSGEELARRHGGFGRGRRHAHHAG
jgi:Ca2+-binding EF-hand superfamily protein